MVRDILIYMDKNRDREILALLLAGTGGSVDQVHADFLAVGIALVDYCLLRLGLDEDALVHAISEYYKLPVIDKKPKKIDIETSRMIPANVARLHKLIAVEKNCGLIVACEDPIGIPIEQIELMTVGWRPRPVIATRSWIRRAQELAYGPGGAMAPVRYDAAWRKDQRIDGWYEAAPAAPVPPQSGNLRVIQGGLPENAPDAAQLVKLVLLRRTEDE